MPLTQYYLQETYWVNLLGMEAAQSTHHCDMCEIGFDSEESLFEHEETEHETCGLEGCTFTGSSRKDEIDTNFCSSLLYSTYVESESRDTNFGHNNAHIHI
jgi:hypothetical protein